MKIFNKRQKTITGKIDDDAASTQWKNWKWQLKHSVKDIKTFEKLLDVALPEKEEKKLKDTITKFPMSVTPYYLSLIDRENYKEDPVYLQAVPSPSELVIGKYDMADPLAEDKDSPVPHLTHRYPDRVLFNISNTCSMYCRHCTRKRKVGDVESIPNKKEILKGVKYIKKHPEIRDVLLSGGDPLMLSNNYLDWVLSEVSAIPHVEMIRIGSRMPVVLPYRITEDLIELLKKYQPLYLNTHFNHPREITASSKKALKMLADAGIILGNQSVLLAGVNDCPRIIKSLSHKLLQNRVRPYYLYQCDLTEGLAHFRTPVSKGIEIIESMIGHTSGLAVPTYVIDAPGGGGKIPIMPNYIISWSTNKVILRNYEGIITSYKEPDSYEGFFCDRDCENCHLQLKLEGKEELSSVGIVKILESQDEGISLVPEDTERMTKRD